MINDWRFLLALLGIVLSSGALVLGVVLRLRSQLRDAAKSVTAAQQTTRPDFQQCAQQLFSDAPVGLGQFALDGRVICCNTALQQLLGMSVESLAASRNLTDMLHPEDFGSVVVMRRDLLDGIESGPTDVRLRHRSGYFLWAQLSLSLVRDERGQPAHFVIAAIDIGQQRRAENIGRATEEKIETIFEHAAAAMWMLSADRTYLLFANNACEALFGCTKERAYAEPNIFQQLIHPEDVEHVAAAMAAYSIARQYAVNYRILRDDGEQRYIREIGKGVCDQHGDLQYLICSAMDISSELDVREELHGLNSLLREANLRLRDSARRDHLTQCLNRAAFFDEAEKTLQLEQRYGRSSTLIFFDLNDFKQLNDNFGHHVGDQGLIDFAEQIKARLRTTDELGRYGGDEFVVLLRETDAGQAEQLLSTLAPVVIDAENGNSIILRYSAGIACSNEPGIDSVDDWMRLADSQMYGQKIRRNSSQ